MRRRSLALPVRIEQAFPSPRGLVGTRLKDYEIEGMSRSAAMAPLSTASVTRLLESHAQLSDDGRDVEGLLQRLGPAWAEVRSILNELNRVLGPDAQPPGPVRTRGRRSRFATERMGMPP